MRSVIARVHQQVGNMIMLRLNHSKQLYMQQRNVSSSATVHQAAAAAAAAAAATATVHAHPPPPRAALVRGLPNSFASGLKMHHPNAVIDVAAARAQHERYTALLRDLVPAVVEVPADDAHPDCVFIEDTVVVTPGGVAVACRPGAKERRGEVAPVVEALRALAGRGGPNEHERPLITDVLAIEPPGLLDGGDVLQVGGFMLVGLTSRTNAAAVGQLRALLEGRPGSGVSRVVGVPVAAGLHLKSAVTALDDSTLLRSDDAAGEAVADAIIKACPELAAQLKAVAAPPGDALAANILRVGRVIVAQAEPAARGALAALCAERGLELRLVPRLSELAKADGALTCCSVLIA